MTRALVSYVSPTHPPPSFQHSALPSPVYLARRPFVLIRTMYTQEEEEVPTAPNTGGCDANAVSVKDIQVASTQAALHTYPQASRPYPLR